MKTSVNPMTNNQTKYSLTNKVNTVLSFILRTFLIQARARVSELAANEKLASNKERKQAIERITRLFLILDSFTAKMLNTEQVKNRFIIISETGRVEEVKQGSVEEISINELTDLLIDVNSTKTVK